MSSISVNQSLSKALKLAKKGQQEKAISLCEKVLLRHPLNPRAAALLVGLVTANDGLSFNELDPPNESCAPFYDLYQKNRFLEALEVAKVLERRFTRSVLVKNFLGTSEYALNNPAAAVAYFEQALTLDPQHFGTLINLTPAFIALQKYDAAFVVASRAVAIRPEEAKSHIVMASVFSALESFLEAEKHLNRAIEIEPNNPEIQNDLGVVKEQLGKLEEAKSCFSRAIDLNPRFALAYNNLGNILYKSKAFETSVHTFK